jgi:hypothetical protein
MSDDHIFLAEYLHTRFAADPAEGIAEWVTD